MADRRRVITLSVVDDFSRNQRLYAQGMVEADKATASFNRNAQSGGGWRQQSQDLFFMAQNAQMLARSFTGVFRTVDQMSQLGLQVQRNKQSLELLAGSAEEANKWIRAIQDASRGATTSGEAASTAFTLMRFGLADTAQEAGTLSKALAVIAATSPSIGSVDQAVGQLQLTLANTSFMRLDQLGLSTIAVKKRMEELQATTEGLSREEAFNQAVMEGLAEQADKYGDTILGVGAKQAAFKAQLREINESLGIIAAVGLDRAITGFENLEAILYGLTSHQWTIEMIVQAAGGGDTSRIIAGLLDATLGTGIAPERPGVGPTITGDVTQMSPTEIRLLLAQLGYYVGPTTRENVSMLPSDTVTSFAPGVTPGEMMSYPVQITPGQESTPNFWGGGTYRNYYARQAQTYASNQTYLFNQDLLDKVRNPSMLNMQSWITGGTGPGGYQEFQEAIAGQAMQDAVSLAGRFAGFISDAAGSAVDFVSSAEQFSSLAEKFGAGASPFNADVMRAASDALKDANLSTRMQTEAMDLLSLATGETNIQTEVFDKWMGDLAERYYQGRIDAEEYAQAVLALSQVDLSNLSKQFDYIRNIDLGLYTDIIAKVQTLTPWQAQRVSMTDQTDWADQRDWMEQALNAPQWDLGQAQIDADTFSSQIEDLKTSSAGLKFILDEPIAQWRLTTTEGEAYITEFRTVSDEQFGALRDKAIADIEAIQFQLEDTFKDYTIKLNITETRTARGWAEPGSYEATQFAAGGYTGDGSSSEPAGIVHRREYVVPEGGALVMRGGGGGGLAIQNVNLYGVQDAQGLLDELESVARGRNVTIMQPLGARS